MNYSFTNFELIEQRIQDSGLQYCKYIIYIICKLAKLASIPVAKVGLGGSVKPSFRVTGSKYFSRNPHMISGISSSVDRTELAMEFSAVFLDALYTLYLDGLV